MVATTLTVLLNFVRLIVAAIPPQEMVVLIIKVKNGKIQPTNKLCKYNLIDESTTIVSKSQMITLLRANI